jgi:hypothetical protein
MKTKEIKALAVAVGILWGVSLMFLAWISNTGYGIDFVEVLSSIYVGYKPTLIGGIAGFFWGLIDGMVSIYLIAQLYTYILKKK